MEIEKTTPGKFAVNYGLVLGAIMILIAVIMYGTGMALRGEQWPNYLYYLAFPAIIIYAIMQYKKHNANTLTLGEAIKTGLIIALISALVYAVYGLLFNYVIDPEFTAKAMEVAKEKLYDNPDMTPEVADQAMKFMEMFSNPFLGITVWIALSAFFGLIYSLIAGLIMKSE